MNNPQLFTALLCLIISLALNAPAIASDTEKTGTFIVTLENDNFGGGTDQHYSNGIMLTWVSPIIERWVDDDRLPKLLTDYGEYAPFVNNKERMRSASLSLGQAIFTPIDVKTSELVENDRPYAGWLFISMGLHSKNETVLDVFETTLGVVGPAALGQQVQNNFHNFIGVKRSEGWNNQLSNEPGLMFTWQRSRRWLAEAAPQGFGLDVIPHIGATLGNIYTHANLGGEVRLGWNLPSNFGSSLIGPARGVSAPTRGTDDNRFGCHIFTGLDARAVARNIFLDGNSWQSSHSVAKRSFVADFYGGLALHWNEFSLTYTQAMRTKEFYGQGKNHVFGSLSLSFAF